MYGNGGRAVKSHVNELYSPSRVDSMVERMGLLPGMSLDLTINDPVDKSRGVSTKGISATRQKRW